ncbi:MAG: hypothetical protein ISR47_06825 [Rhodospirillales bacterium]|nr:hypothetical protein [Rhodospirillales bacterium]
MYDQPNHAMADVGVQRWNDFVPTSKPAPTPTKTETETVTFVSAERVLYEERADDGMVYVLYLGEFFRVLGGRTDRLANALHLMGDSLLRDWIRPGDSFTFHPQGFFLIRLHDEDAAAARTRAESLIDDLGIRAVGDRYISWREIHAHETVHGSPAVNDD